MNAEIKKKWVAALRSGAYKQGTGSLKKDDRFCCLGVLCELAAKENICETEEVAGGFKHYDLCQATTPSSVQRWADLGNSDPNIFSKHLTLSVLNDNGSTFSEIADLIEEEL